MNDPINSNLHQCPRCKLHITGGYHTIINGVEEWFCSRQCMKEYSELVENVRIIVLRGDEDEETLDRYKQIRELVW